MVPCIAGSRSSLLLVIEAKKNGEAWCRTVVIGGEDCTARSKAPGIVMSGTMKVSSWDL